MKLDEANKIYAGATLASAVYVGANKVWPGGAPPWTPDGLGGLEVWLDASKLTGADGSRITTWPNLGSGPQPTIVTQANPLTLKAAFQNGLNVARFNYSGDMLRGTCSITKTFTAIYVVRHWGNDGGKTGRALTAFYPPANTLIGMHISQADCAYDGGWFHATAMGWATYLTLSQEARWRIYSADMDIAGADRFWVNGTANYSAKGPSDGLNGTYNISGYGSGIDETCDIDICELLIYNKVLADADRVAVEGYLRTKWGLP